MRAELKTLPFRRKSEVVFLHSGTVSFFQLVCVDIVDCRCEGHVGTNDMLTVIICPQEEQKESEKVQESS